MDVVDVVDVVDERLRMGDMMAANIVDVVLPQKMQTQKKKKVGPNYFGSFCYSFFPPPPPYEFRARAQLGIKKEFFFKKIKPNSNDVSFKRK